MVQIDAVPWPEESLEVIYEWVEDWDQTWAGIYLWWKYVDENKISILKVHDTNLHNMTKESVIQQNKVIPTAIAIADLQWPEGQCRFNINDLFGDYQEWVEERAWLEAERLAKAPSMGTQGQAERGEGQDCAPDDTEGCLSRGAACLIGGGSGSVSKGKGKQKATSEEDKLADDVDNDEGDGEGKAPVNEPPLTLPFNELQIRFEPFSATATGLLNEPGGVEEAVQSATPLVTKILEVENPHEWLTASFVKHLQVLEVRAEGEEFELEQVYQLLEMLARQVTHQIETAWARWEEL
ncbi:hypothetical protein F5J12DRAFT_896421 [Pisolithus orientalis]|uniref:uncharacterized protein n=1 Tax=Pisolithus orientalis TaxID=936130 RepID=UPI0022252B19|nr:uncharacterized protein F5J12DRAFT_896421 [Pisolithus orientalis]KAI5995788.1 hypothetical protein F5J12DRAFT_896421 [Pisolithus orientalis]